MVAEILIEYEVYRKMMAYAQIADEKLSAEIGGLLVVDELEEGGLFVRDALLPEQEVTGGTFKVKVGKWMKNLKFNDLKNIRGMWHSHRNMGTFHSGTDDDTLGDKWDGENKNTNSYGVSIVVALPNEIKAYVQYYKPIKTTNFTVPIKILHSNGDNLYKECEKLIAERASKPEVKPYDWQADVRSELPESKSKSQPKSVVRKIKSGLSMEEIEEMVVDALTGRSVADLKAMGQWNPVWYPELVEEMEEMIWEETDIKTEESFETNKAGESLNFKQVTDPSECPHLFMNNKEKLVCFFQGKNYDCSNCASHPKNLKKKNQIVPVKKKEEELAEAPEDTKVEKN